MSRYAFKVPDLGEGTVTSEIVAWRVAVGDLVQEDAPLAELSTDKAVVEVSSPVTGRVVALAGQPGDTVAVGSELVVFETEAEGEVAAAVAVAGKPAPTSPATAPAPPAAARTGRVMASPATRRRAKEAGLDLATVAGSGPGGRIEKRDLEAALASPATGPAPAAPVGAGMPATGPATGLATLRTAVEEIKVIGVRRVIAQRMAEAKRTIPHFSYVEEVDVTALEALRVHLNKSRARDEAYTYLPFVIAALVRVLPQFPQCNAHYDAERNVLLRHAGVHVGVATQTPDGLKVPVVRHAEARTLSGLAAEVRRVSGAARNNTAKREELSGSTITVTSLGKLGGIVSTPVINLPEVAIIGLNKAVERPMVVDGAVVVRRMMNLSSSFDHRFVDGFDAAAMVQALKERLENPATIFMAD